MSGRRRGRGLPEGTSSVGVGLAVLGVTTYLFFAVSARALGPDRYGSLSVLWTLVFFAAPGAFFPVEQEAARAVAARAVRGEPAGNAVRLAVRASLLIAVLLMTASAAGAPFLLGELFDDNELLLVGLLLSFPVYAVTHAVRGGLSGSGRFAPYGVALAVEGLVRSAGAIALSTAGVDDPGIYGLLIAFPPVLALSLACLRHRALFTPGPPAAWRDFSTSLWWLLAGAVLSQAFINVSVPLVKALAAESDAELAGQFQAALIISRVPLFLFQAVQAALLPKLVGSVAGGRMVDFRTGLRRAMFAVVAIAVVGILGAMTVGPTALRIAFGDAYTELGRRDLTLLAVSSGAFMVATVLSQALIALGRQARVTAAWLVALLVFAGVVAQPADLLIRVELALVAGSLAAIVTMAAVLRGAVRAVDGVDAFPFIHAQTPQPDLIDP